MMQGEKSLFRDIELKEMLIHIDNSEFVSMSVRRTEEHDINILIVYIVSFWTILALCRH